MNLQSLAIRLRRKLGLSLLPPVSLARKYPQYNIGDKSYGYLKITDFGAGDRVRIGNYCSTARGSQVLLGGGHPIEWATTYPFPVFEKSLAHIKGHPVPRGDVVIGNDVWIASDAMIMSGVTIGDGAVIMARAVVVRDVAPYAIVGGSPATERGKRFDEATIARLLALKWWEWPHERIVAAGPHLLSADIGSFLDLAERDEI